MRVTSFMLADAAQVSAGKLFVIGGGWNILTVSETDLPIHHRGLALVTLLDIAWHETNQSINFEINLVDEDEKPVIPEPLRGELKVGRPTLLPTGAAQLWPLVVNFNDLAFQRLGTYAFTFRVGDDELARAPFHLIPLA